MNSILIREMVRHASLRSRLSWRQKVRLIIRGRETKRTLKIYRYHRYVITSCEADILQEAERLKQEGNHHFRSKAWEEALAQYKSALGHLPGRIREPPREPVEPREPSDPEAAEVPTPETLPATPPQPRNEESPEIVKARAVLNANVGACYVQLVGKLSYVAVPCLHPTCHRESTKRLLKHARKVGVESHLHS